jgi:hypothetical protein
MGFLTGFLMVSGSITISKNIKRGEFFGVVGTICINQNDEEDKQAQISIMNHIYGGAWATIVALEGDSPSSGLSRMRPNRYFNNKQVVSDIGNFRLVTVLPTLNQQIAKSKWATRGWTYQEATIFTRYLPADLHEE